MLWHYADALPDMQEQAADVLDAVSGGDSPTVVPREGVDDKTELT